MPKHFGNLFLPATDLPGKDVSDSANRRTDSLKIRQTEREIRSPIVLQIRQQRYIQKREIGECDCTRREVMPTDHTHVTVAVEK